MVSIVGFIYSEATRWLQAPKVDKGCNMPWCENHTRCRAFLGLCTYYRIWIPEYAIVAGPLLPNLMEGHRVSMGE